MKNLSHIRKFSHPVARRMLFLAVGILAAGSAFAAAPDLTAPGVIAGIDRSATYNLGPTGLRGWIYVTTGSEIHGSNGTMTGESRQILVTVASTPASAVLAVDDVILGAMAASTGDVPDFTSDARKAFGAAITEAEKTGGGTLRVKRWRAETITDVNIPITIMGDYTATAPYSCPKSSLILANASNKLVAQLIADANFLTNDWKGAISGLALLAGVQSGDPDFTTVQTRLQTYARARATAGPQAVGLPIWDWAYSGLFLTEYYLATSDASVLPGINSYTIKLAQSQSINGTFGHNASVVRSDGSGRRMGIGYGPVNAVSIVANMAIVMGKKALVKGAQSINPEIDGAIQRGSDFYAFYVNKGPIPYGEHGPDISGHSSNGKDPMCAVLFGVQSNRAAETEYFSRMSIAGYNGREYGHTGQGFSYLWGALGANMGGTLAVAEHLKPVRWHLDLSRRTDGSFAYDGAEQYGAGSTSDGTYLGASGYSSLNTTASYILTYALPLQRLYITGKRDIPANPVPLVLDTPTVAHAIAAANFKIDCPGFSDATLITSLSDYDPVVRNYAAIELGKRSATIAPADFTTLRAMVTGPSANGRMGACQALGLLQDATALPTIVQRLEKTTETDLWVRAKAASAIRGYTPATASTYRDTMLTAFVANATDPDNIAWSDPIQMSNSFLSFALFGNSIYGGNNIAAYTVSAPKNLLYPAVQVGLKQPDSMPRSGATTFCFDRLPLADVQALIPDFFKVVEIECLADRMWASDSRSKGIGTFSKYKISEGIPYALAMLDIPAGFEHGSLATRCAGLDALASYGDAARWILPKLRSYFGTWDPNHYSPDQYATLINTLGSTITSIENAITSPAQAPGLAVANSQVIPIAGPVAITLTGSSPRSSVTFTNVTAPAHGTLTGTAPDLTYTPNPGYTGPDFFTFQVMDNLGVSYPSAPGTVSLIFGSAGTGLKGEYFNNSNFTNLALTRTDPQVNFDWGTGSPHASIGADTFSVRWSSLLLVPESGNYRFSSLSSEGMRLYVNGALVIDNFTDQSTRWTDGASIYLSQGQMADILIEYYDNTGSAVAKLKWIGPSFAGVNGAIIPQAYLFDGSTIPNRPAFAFPQNLTTNKNIALPITLKGSGGSLTYTVLTQPANGTLSGTAPNLTYTPNSNFTGTDSFTFLVNNGSTNSVPATITLGVQAGALTQFNWATATTGTWSDAAKWTPSAPVAAGQPNYALNFNVAGTYTATHDLTSGFQLNQLNTASTVTVDGTRRLSFVANGGTQPTFNQNGANTVTVVSPVELAAITHFGGSGSGEVVLTQKITGSGGILKTGSGRLRIHGATANPNTFTGGTTINNGTLVLGGFIGTNSINTNNPLGTGPVTLNGATIEFEYVTASNPLTVNGGTFYCNNGWGSTWSGPVTLNHMLTTSGYWPITISGSISGASGIIKIGSNTLTLSVANTYTGTTEIREGSFICSNVSALGSGPLIISPGGKAALNFTGTRSIASLTLNGALMSPGTYGSNSSNATNKNDTYFSGTGTVTVLQPTTTALSLTTGSSPAAPGSSLTFTATVSGSSPTGNVQFFSGITLLGSSMLNGSPQATFTTNQLAIGPHSITARYVGDSANGSSNSAAMAVEIAPVAPASPTNLTATAVIPNINLVWSASAGASSYYVKRSTTNGGPYTFIALVNGTTYQDSTITAGITYHYVISAINAAGEGGNSNQASALVTGVVTDADVVIVPEGGTKTFQVKLSALPPDNVIVTVARSSGDSNITMFSGSSLTFTNTNWDSYQTVTLAAANDADALDSPATITCTPNNAGYATKIVTATEDDTNSYTVSYNGNTPSSGTPPVDAVSPYVQGATVTVLGNTENLIKIGYAFAGWNTEPSGSGTTYAPGATLTMPGSSVTLHAVWNTLPTADAGSDITTNLTELPPVYGWSYAPWTGDADSGISSEFPYTIAHSFGDNNGGSVTVNGVAFTENFNTSGTGWSIAGTKADWTGDDNAVITGNSEKLAQEFIYNANPRTVTFTGLTVGVTYEATFFSVAWETGNRNQTFSATGGNSAFINQSVYNDNNGIRISYIYIATATSQQFTITPETGTFHLYAMSNKDITVNFASVSLNGTVGDLESDPLTTTWSQISGPAPAIITDSSAVDTTAEFPQVGTYVLQLTADDGFGITSDTVIITVDPPIVSVVTSSSTVQVPEGSTATFQAKLSNQPSGNVTVTVARSFGDSNISSASVLSFTTSNWNTYQTVTLAAANDADVDNGSATITCTPSNGAYTAANVTATETDKDTTLTVSNGGNGSTTPSGAIVVQKNSATAISATPNAGYDFVNWTVTSGSATFGNANSASTTATISLPATIRANFAIPQYTLTYNAGTGGTISGNASQTVTHGSAGTEVTAVASSGYTFTKWSDNVTTASRTDTSVTANLNVTAEFTVNPDIHWNGSTSTAWATAGNWDAAPTNDLVTHTANFNLAAYSGNPVFAPHAGTTSIKGIALGASNGTMTLTTTNLSIGASGISIANGAGAFTISGSTTLGAAQSWTNNSSNLFTFGAVTNGANLLTIGGSGNTTSSGIIGSGTGDLTKNDTGILNLTAANTYTGLTYINSGTVQLGNSTALGTGTGSMDGTIIHNGATLDLGGKISPLTTTLGERITLSGSGVGGNGAIISSSLIATPFIGVRYLTLVGDTTLGFTNRWDIGVNSALGGTVTGNGHTLNLIGSGSGQTSLNWLGATDLGDININLGNASTAIVYLQGTTTLGRAANTLTISGGSTLDVYSNSTVASFDKKFALNTGNITVEKTGAVALLGTISLTGTSNTIAANTATVVTTASGVISGTGGLIKAGLGSLTLSNANTYTGATTISAGLLSLGNALALQSTTLDTTGSIASSSTTTGLKTTVTSLTLGGLTGNKNFSTLFNAANGYTGLTALTLNPVTGATNSYFANIGNGNGGMTLTKDGSGTQAFTVAQTYTGSTTINAGTLFLSGATQATTSITFTGGSLGLDTGVTVAASNAAVNLTNGTIQVTGSTGAASYTLLTASSINGTPVLAAPVPGYALLVVGNQLRLVSLIESWATQNGLSGGNTASNADPDGDGWINLQEFAFGTQPNAGQSGPLEFVPGGEVTKTGSPVLRAYTPPQGLPPFQAVFGRRKNHAAAGLSYSVEFSANLSYWTSSNSGSTVLTGAGSHEIEVVAVPFPETVPLSLGGTQAPPKFFRIVISQN